WSCRASKRRGATAFPGPASFPVLVLVARTGRPGCFSRQQNGSGGSGGAKTPSQGLFAPAEEKRAGSAPALAGSFVDALVERELDQVAVGVVQHADVADRVGHLLGRHGEAAGRLAP